MQMKLPPPNNTEENTISKFMARKSTIYITTYSSFLEHFWVQFGDSLKRLQQMTLVSAQLCSDFHWLLTLRSKCGFHHCN